MNDGTTRLCQNDSGVEQSPLGNHLNLLSHWTGTCIDNVCLGSSSGGGRGLFASKTLPIGTTVVLLPWKYVLGTQSALRLLDEEQRKGRGMDDDNRHLLADLRLACSIAGSDQKEQQQQQEHDKSTTTEQQQQERQRVWSCVMACAVLAAARYPLSAWGPYVSSLPFYGDKIELALRRCHALTVRQIHKRQHKEQQEQQQQGETTTTTTRGSRKLSQDVLQKLKRIRNGILSKPRHAEQALSHVLLWDLASLQWTNDDVLVSLVREDWHWLRVVYQQVVRSVVSWESWLWAHAIVRSRAVGLDHSGCLPVRGITSSTEEEDCGVLLPIVDMINHHSTHPNAALEIRLQGVAVVTTNQPIPQGQEILFGYHPNPTLRFLLRSYGFVDSSGGVRQFFPITPSLGLDVLDSHNGMFRVERIQQRENRAGIRSTVLVLRNDDSPTTTTVQPELTSPDAIARVSAVVAMACRILASRFEEEEEEDADSIMNAASKSYRAKIYELLIRCEQDMNVVRAWICDTTI